MRYWNVQRIVREYVCPVRMVTQILGEMSAPGHIQSPEHGYPGTERGLRNNRRNMRSPGESSPGKNRTICFLKGRRHAKVRKYPFSHFRRG